MAKAINYATEYQRALGRRSRIHYTTEHFTKLRTMEDTDGSMERPLRFQVFL